jgi:putative membrane protein
MDFTGLWLNLAASEGISINVNEIVNALVYTGIGVVVFGLAFWAMCKIAPFSMQKEIEEDQNTSLGIIVGSVIIGLAIVIAAAVHGGTTVVYEAPKAVVAPATSGQ